LKQPSAKKTAVALTQALNGLENGTTGDFVAMDIREAMLQLGNITGQIDIDTDIFGRFSKRLYWKIDFIKYLIILQRFSFPTIF
jgi:tRNA U34 5-carboxymethylaminomethyl modifying GTPase MnmE/TrmE